MGQTKQLAAVCNNSRKNRGCLPFVKIRLLVCKSSWIQLEDEKVNQEASTLYLHVWVLSREVVWWDVCDTPGVPAQSCCRLSACEVVWVWAWLPGGSSAMPFASLPGLHWHQHPAVLLNCPPRTDWQGLLEGKIHRNTKERADHTKGELSTAYDQCILRFC